MNKYFLIILVSCGLLAKSNSQSQKSITIPKVEIVDSLMMEYRIPTVGICIIEKGAIKYTNVFGNLPQHSPAPLNTFFNIASLTKPITSTTTLILVSQGQWKLDEPLYHYWIDPDVVNDIRHKKLTTRHVLSHRSGLPNWRGHEPDGKLSFAFEPGEQWKYSGEGFEYLRKALEQKFKKPFEKLVDSLLFRPVGMNNTRFFWDETMDATLYANRHRDDGSPYDLESWGEANPSNLVLTTVSDYAKFGIAVMSQYGVTKEVYKEMITNQAPLPDNREWGLGWRLINNLTSDEYALVHTGGNPGINTIVVLLPKSKNGLVIFTNGAKGDQLYERLMVEILKKHGGEIVSKMK